MSAPLTPAELEAIRKIQYDVESFEDFIKRVAPRFWPIPRHLKRLVQLIQESREREVRAIVSMPPRHGKSATLLLGLAWRNLYDPACLNFYVTFGDDLATVGSRTVRALVRKAGVPLNPAVQNVQNWETSFGGGLKSTSVGGQITGRGCNGGMIVGDDLIKGRDKAESLPERDRTFTFLRSDCMSRLEPGASLFIPGTRWHEDDPIGRLIDPQGGPDWDPFLGEDWEYINLPAIGDADGNPVDERINPDRAIPLWPEGGWDLERLARIRARGEYDWWSLYQGQPSPRGGAMFKRDWFNYLDNAPSSNDGRAVRAWDMAATASSTADWTVTGLVRITDAGRIVIEDVERLQGSPGDVEALMLEKHRSDPLGLPWRMPKEPAAAGKFQAMYFAGKLHGRVVHFMPETTKKDLRAQPLAAQAQALNVDLVRGGWNAAFVAEFASFPMSKNDDQVDMVSGAYEVLVMREETTSSSFGTPRLLRGAR